MVFLGNLEFISYLYVIEFYILLLGEYKIVVVGLWNLMVFKLVENRVVYEGYIINDVVEYEE